MKLTPAMKQTLRWMRDDRQTISKWIGDSKYYLRTEYGDFIKHIKSDWMISGFEYFLTQSYENQIYIYRVREDAEFTQEWLDGERKRVAQDAYQKREDEEAERDRRNREATKLFGCTEGLYTVKMYGQWPFKGEIWRGDDYLMDFSAGSSTKDTFEDVFYNEENKAYFDAIRQMIHKANQ